MTETLYFGIMLHLIGDYLTQNHWMAVNKTKAHFPALLHAFIYSLPFLLLVPSVAWLIIFGTHFLIDRYRLAVLHTRFVNNTKTPLGYPEGTPDFLAVWLVIIIDNVYHLLFNTVAIAVHYTLFA